MLRFGLCCQILNAPIRFRTTTVTNLKKIGDSKKEFLFTLIQHNIAALKQAIEYCSEHKIGCFRINSQFLPCYTHSEVGYTLDEIAPSLKPLFSEIKNLKKNLNIRLSMHPDQFVVLSTPHINVLKNSIAEIEYQNMLGDLVGVDVINIHGGGVYGDKKTALKRFEKAFFTLSSSAQKKLTLENDDKSYTPKDLIPLCHYLDIPLVYDVHHHRCLPDGNTIEYTTEKVLETWKREPLFHLSSPAYGWKGGKIFKHHDYINPNDFPKNWLTIDPLTIEIEAKAKDLAILRLMKDLKRSL